MWGREGWVSREEMKLEKSVQGASVILVMFACGFTDVYFISRLS